VRLEAQRILQRHLNRVEHPDDYWEHERIILTGAYLEDVAFDDCELRRADFSDAIFAGTADFPHARFPTGATFRGARFLGTAIFIGAEFYSDAEYLARRKPGQLEFAEQHCADFRDVVFSDVSEWTVVKFFDDASFERARFSRSQFSAVSFKKGAFFQDVAFEGTMHFDVRECTMSHFDRARAISEQPHFLHESLMLKPDPEFSGYQRLTWSREPARKRAES
jgi:hypothetical protein